MMKQGWVFEDQMFLNVWVWASKMFLKGRGLKRKMFLKGSDKERVNPLSGGVSLDGFLGGQQKSWKMSPPPERFLEDVFCGDFVPFCTW